MSKNLLKIKGIGPLLRSGWTWRLARAGALLLLVFMAACGWRYHGIPGISVKDPLMYTNLANYFFWVLWIMGVVFVALFFGRGWCAVCPLGWLNGIVSRFGLKLPVPGGVGHFVVTAVLVALQLAVYLLAVHRYPDYTASLLALMILLAVLAGLLFRKRAFCTLLCPAGAVFGLYARIAPFQLRAADSETCASCDSKDCIAGTSVWRRFELGRGILYWHSRRADCPVDLVPAEIEDSVSCTLCLHCARNCEKGNILLGRRPWLEDLGKKGLSASETLFFLVLLGMLTANFSKVYVDLREAIFWLPQNAALMLGWESAGFYLLATLWVTLGLPLLLMLPGYLVLRLSELKADVGDPAVFDGNRVPEQSIGFWPALGRLALPVIPLVLAAHVVLAVVKLNAKGGYLPYVLLDPTGVKSYLAMNVMQTVRAPGVLLSLDVLKWFVLALVVGGWLVSLAAARRSGRGLYGRNSAGYLAGSIVGISLLAALYGAVVIRWLFIR